ncbi:hypothetical protein B0H34DRAFT_665908 [Crassisporium funariophilum]|nr:hypothetical protein B0H34DRAFT_665908 [Crassisporium funariophilum]
MSDQLTLTLQPDNPCNTTLIDTESGEVYYKVSTEHGKKSVTYVKDPNGGVIASWEWREYLSDLITFGSTKPIAVSAWLHKSMIPMKRTVSFKDDIGRAYEWKNVGSGVKPELYTSDSEVPIVRFQTALRWMDRETSPPVEKSRPAALIITPRGQEIMNLAVIGFLVLERKRRMNETSMVNRANAEAMQMDPRKMV